MPRQPKVDPIQHLNLGEAATELKPAESPRNLELEITQRYMQQEALRRAARVGPQPMADLPAKTPALERLNSAKKKEVAPLLESDVLIERARERMAARKKRMDAAAEETDLDTVRAAQLLLNKFRSLSAEWGHKIDALRDERHLSESQIAISLMAYALDSGHHMNIPQDHPYFSEKFEPAGTKFNCVICDLEQERKYPGQPPLCIVSEHRCADRFHAMPQEAQQELLAAAAA